MKNQSCPKSKSHVSAPGRLRVLDMVHGDALLREAASHDIRRFSIVKPLMETITVDSFSSVEIERMTGFSSKHLGGKVDFLFAEQFSLPFPDEIFDVVFVCERAFGARYVIQEQISKEVSRVIKPSGHVIIPHTLNGDDSLRRSQIGMSLSLIEKNLLDKSFFYSNNLLNTVSFLKLLGRHLWIGYFDGPYGINIYVGKKEGTE